MTIPPGAYEVESLNNQTKSNFTDEENFTEAYYHFLNKTKFSTSSNIV